MSDISPYEKLLADPVWGPECRTISSLPDAPYCGPAIVGGAVRDLVIGRSISDIDIATAVPGTARNLAKAFAKATGRTLVEYKHEQGIYRVAAANAPQVDFTDPVGGTRESDLYRRDFTINAIALGLVAEEKGRISDPTNGLKDISEGIIRATGEGVFDDDPLRVLRAFRFSAELGFKIEKGTLEALAARSERLKDVAGERIQPELLGILDPDGAAEQVVSMDAVGIIEQLFPELQLSKGVEQNVYHHLEVWEHTLEAIRQIERVLRFEEEVLEPFTDRTRDYINYSFPSGHSRRELIKLAVLLHDIAKPHCRGQRDDGRITFIGHERMGSELVRELMARLKFPRYERDFVCRVIEGHLRPAVFGREDQARPRVAYRFFRDYGDKSVAIILISLADRLAAQGPMVTEKVNQRHRDAVAFLLKALFERSEVMVRPPQIVDGNTLIQELSLKPGPMIGHLLRCVQEAQAMGEVNTREDAIELCRRLIAEGDKIQQPD